MQVTYRQPIKHSLLLFEMSREAACIYNKAIAINKQGKNFKDLAIAIDSSHETLYLHSQSAQAAYQLWIQNMKSYFGSVVEYEKNPSKFKNVPQPPYKTKFMQPITFKKSAIRHIDGFLYLSIKKPFDPIKIRWNENLPIPEWIIISYNRFTGWNINYVLEKKTSMINSLDFEKEKVMAIDLGVKRVATTFDGEHCITYSGKELMSLTRLKNKINAETKIKLSRCKNGSKRHKRICRANRKLARKIDNKQKDILHKTSRTIVNDAIANNVSRIVIGDCGSIHDKTNCGKQNQKIQQNPEQKLRKYVEYKFQSVGGDTEVPSERGTSSTCPRCKHKHKPSNRTFKCPNCGFIYDRDGVGAVNIYRQDVSLSEEEFLLNVVGRMTRPRGRRYHSREKCTLPLNEKWSLVVCEAARSRFVEETPLL